MPKIQNQYQATSYSDVNNIDVLIIQLSLLKWAVLQRVLKDHKDKIDSIAIAPSRGRGLKQYVESRQGIAAYIEL